MYESAIKPPKPLKINSDSDACWEDWLQSYEWFAEAKQLANKSEVVQVATFMTSLGIEAQKIFKTFNLTAAQKLDLTLIKSKFTQYFSPKRNYTFERFRFNQMKQSVNESFQDYLTRLKLQISKCNFSIMEDELLKDRIVVGIVNNDLREKLLSDPDLDLDKCTQLCLASESASLQLKNISGDNSSQEIYAISKSQNKSYKNAAKYANYKQPNKNQTKYIESCRNCGNSHNLNECPAYGKRCKSCNKLNHFATKCRSKGYRNFKVDKIESVDEIATEKEESYVISAVGVNSKDDWFEEVTIGNKVIPMKLDTGAQCNAIPFEIAKELNLKIQPSTIKKLLAYSGHGINVAGESIVSCTIKNKGYQIKLVVAHGGISPILGRKSCIEAGLIKRVEQLTTLKDEFSDLFTGMGCIKNFEYTADFSSEFPKCEIRPPRRIPFSLRPAVKKELDKMVQDGIIRKIEEPTPVASQLVVAKQKGKIRICIDPSEVNKFLLRRQFPLTTIEEIVTNVKDSKYFTKLDLKKGFWQLKVSEQTQPYLTVITPWGRYCFLRVPFGIKTAPELFQNQMSEILKGIPGVENSMDDTFIHAPDLETLRQRTRLVLEALRNSGAKLNKEKCEFEKKEIKFLGHILSSQGVRIDTDKVETIDRIKSPKTKKELQRLLGMVQYLHKFIPNLSEKTHNMRLLLKKNTAWMWDENLDKDLKEIKDLIKIAPTLSYFDPNKEVTISVDSSSFALGAVLLQNGNPIAYSSTALSPAQQLYPQIEKEALAMRYGCKKFHQYVYGKELVIETDHKPLESIYGKSVDRIPPRLQKIFFEIQQYGPIVRYKSGKDLHIADLLSRDCHNENSLEETDLQVFFAIPATNESIKTLQNLTAIDPELMLVKHFISTGWPKNKDYLPDSCKKYLPFADELSCEKDLILKGLKVVIPEKFRNRALNSLHEGHLGITSCLNRARDCMYWPGMTQDIISMIENCITCQRVQKSPPSEDLKLNEIPKLPWEIVASDIFTFESQDYLLITDSYSGYIDFKLIKDQTSTTIIQILKEWFSTHGVPKILLTDNATNYSSSEFKAFSNKWMFEIQNSSPLYPKSNGLAERAVQTAKGLLKKCKISNQDIHLAMLNFRNTPRANLGSPAQRLYSRRLRSTIPLCEEKLKPSLLMNVSDQLFKIRQQQKTYHDRRVNPVKEKIFSPNQSVMMKRGHRDWVPAKIIEKAAPRSYMVSTPTGEYRRNNMYIRPTKLNFNIERKRRTNVEIPNTTDRPVKAVGHPTPVFTTPTPPPAPPPNTPKVISVPVTRTRYGRVIRPPDRLKF